MTSAVVEPEVAEAVRDGRQLVLLHVDAPTDRDGFLVVPTGDAPEVTTWCRLVGLVPVDDGRVAPLSGAGVWSADRVQAMLTDHPGLLASLVAPRRLPEPVPVEPVDAEPGRTTDLEVDLDVDTTEPVLDEDELTKRHELIKVALGLMV